MESITSRDNRAIKEYVKLRESRAFREKQGMYVIESAKLVQEALQSGVIFEKVFVTQPSLTKHYAALQRLFDRTQDNAKHAKIYTITEDLEHKMTLTGNAQGLFAVCKMLDKPHEFATIENNGKDGELETRLFQENEISSGKYIFLEQLQDTGNVGTILRTAEALGLDGVIVSKNTCDRYSLKVLRASMGAVFRVKIYQSEDTCADLQNLSKRFTTYAAVLDAGAPSLVSIQFPPNSIVVIGNEGNGLPQEVIAACTQTVTIAMQGNAESLNASMAAGILMWEMMR